MTRGLLSSVAIFTMFLVVSSVQSAEREKGYTLEEVPSKDAGGLVITKYDVGEDWTLSEKYYRVSVKEDGGRTVYTEPQDSLTGDVDADFVDIWSVGDSGALFIQKGMEEIGNITGDFVGNFGFNGSSITNGSGGAITNYGTIGSIMGDFVENSLCVSGRCWGQGGAIYNSGIIKNIISNFIGNFTGGDLNTYGGAIYNERRAEIGNITGDFVRNYINSDTAPFAGAIYNLGSISSIINSNFINNYVKSRKGAVIGGAILNRGTIGNIIGNFIGNYAVSIDKSAYGGAIYNNGTISNITNSNFIDNLAMASDSADSKGGAIYSTQDLLITADNGTSLFSGNMANDKSNAIYMSNAALNLSAKNDGVITFDDGIDGKNYDINIDGDGTGEVRFNNLVENVTNFNMAPNAVVHLGASADIQTENMSVIDSVQRSAAAPVIKLDVALDAATKTANVGQIHVAGDVSGDYRVLVNPLNREALTGETVPFLFAENDDMDTASSFEVARVWGSPYEYEKGAVNVNGDEAGSVWYLNIPTESEMPEEGDGDDKPDEPTKPVYAPEVAAYAGLLSAAVEQNRSIAGSVANGLAYRKSLNCYEQSCGVAEVMPKRQAWIDMTHENAKIDAPAEMDAKINGVTLGLDLYRDGAVRAGLFGAYRYGQYDLSGKGQYYAASASDIRSKSYLGGAYYQYDDGDVRLTGTVFAGNQDMEIKTDDKIARADSDVAQYGASVEVAKRFAVSDYWALEPSFGLYYTMLDADDLEDNVGKSAKFDDLHYFEAEAGVKLEREVCADGQTNRFYIKPSVIRTFSEGGRVKISGLDKARSVKDATLGRVELGGDFGLSESWSGYAHTGVTFGADYESYDFTVGAQYRF